MMIIHPIKAFSDNYIWIIEEGTEAIVIDPGEAAQVIDYLEKKHLQLNSILLTHNHEDHIGGVQKILTFSAGCGRVFTKDYQAQYDALQKFKELDDEVKVYAAHEYTQTNLRFAHAMKPSDTLISEALSEVNNLRINGESTLPTTIGREKSINLFLQAEKMEDFKELRKARDDFYVIHTNPRYKEVKTRKKMLVSAKKYSVI